MASMQPETIESRLRKLEEFVNQYVVPTVRQSQAAVDETTEKLRVEFLKLTDFYMTLQRELHSYLVAQSLGANLDEVPLHRFVTTRVYLDTEDMDRLNGITESLSKFL